MSPYYQPVWAGGTINLVNFSGTPAQGLRSLNARMRESGGREREAVCGRVTPLFRRCQKSAQWPTGGSPEARLGPGSSGRGEADEEGVCT